MLRLASLSTLALISTFALLACDNATIASSTGSSGGTASNSSSSSSSSSGTGGSANTCTAAGGTCVALVPDACENGTWGDANTYSCGGGEGVGCCLPKAPSACEQAGGTCVAFGPGACANGTISDTITCAPNAEVVCCIPTPTCDVTCNTEGAKRCIAGAVETCATNPMTNCAPVWGSPVPCGQDEQCSSDGTKCVPITSTCNANTDCGCGCGCVNGTCQCAGALPPTCTADSECGPECSGFQCLGGKCQAPACQPGLDQTCNENLSMNSFAGTCNADATCTCKPGFTKKASGKCG
ncbi:MAG: hypothetical protein QM820_25630 [Minicystis sp.]